MEIRLFQLQDVEQIAQLFHDTVHEINIQDYSNQQVEAWAPNNIYFRNWAKICATRFTYIADQNGLILGFGELEANGHIGCFYCHKNYQRCGVGRLIYQQIERKALYLHLKGLFTEASITAKPFFAQMGFTVLQKQQVYCRGVSLTNYLMGKSLIHLHH